MGKFENQMGKEGPHSQKALKHQQQMHQVSFPVSNNVTTFPITILDVNFQKTIPT